MAKGVVNLSVVVVGTFMAMRDILLTRNTAGCVCGCQIAKWCNTCSSHSRFAQDDRTLGAPIFIKSAFHGVNIKIRETGEDAMMVAGGYKSGIGSHSATILRISVSGNRNETDWTSAIFKCYTDKYVGHFS
jgi:hypothetical protein